LELLRQPDLGEWLAVLGWFAVGFGVLVATAHLDIESAFGPGPRFFSVFLSIPLLLLAAVQAFTLAMSRVARPSRSVDVPAGATRGAPGEGVRFMVLAGSLFLFAGFLEVLGSLTATALLAWSALVLLGRPMLRSAFEGVASALLFHWSFSRLLGVQLPASRLPLLNWLGF
jgi:hypothetical protein